MTKEKKVLVSGYIGFSNFGDDGMLSVLVEHLKALGCEVSALSSNVKYTEENFGIKGFGYKNFSEIFKAVKACDILVSGGGNLIQNETSTLSLLYYLFIIFLAKIFFKKVILFSQGIGPVKGFLPTLISKLILRLPDLITVRDVYSQRILSKWKIHSKLVYDAAWNLKLQDRKFEHAVGVQVRNYKLLNPNFYKNLAKYIDMFFSDYEIRIFAMENTNDASECYKFEKDLKRRNPMIKTKVVLYENPSKTCIELSKLNYLIAMRLHANIYGLSAGIKILPLVYSVKVRNLAYEFNLPYLEAAEEGDFHSAFSSLVSDKQEAPKLLDARKRRFEWVYIDSIINK